MKAVINLPIFLLFLLNACLNIDKHENDKTKPDGHINKNKAIPSISFQHFINLIDNQQELPFNYLLKYGIKKSIDLDVEKSTIEGYETIKLKNGVQVLRFNEYYTLNNKIYKSYSILTTFIDSSLIATKRTLEYCSICNDDDLFSEIIFPSDDSTYFIRIDYYKPVHLKGMIHPKQKKYIKFDYITIDKKGKLIITPNKSTIQ